MRNVMLIVHFLGLAMGVGTSFAFLFLGIAASKMEKIESQKFRLNILTLSKMGHIGLALLILSGGYLMTPYWSVLSVTPLLIAKLSLVLLLTIIIVVISIKAKEAKRGDIESSMKKIEPLGKISLLISLTIVILAVLFFK